MISSGATGESKVAIAACRLSLPSELTLAAAVFNLADRDPPEVRLTDYSYDPLFAKPIGRAFKLTLTQKFR